MQAASQCNKTHNYFFEMFTSVVIFNDAMIFISIAQTWTETEELGLLNFNLKNRFHLPHFLLDVPSTQMLVL